MTQRRRFLLLISSLAMIGYFGYTYMYKDHRDIKTEVSEIEIVALIYWKGLKMMMATTF